MEIDDVDRTSSKDHLASANVMLDVGAVKALYSHLDVLTESEENSVGQWDLEHTKNDIRLHLPYCLSASAINLFGLHTST